LVVLAQIPSNDLTLEKSFREIAMPPITRKKQKKTKYHQCVLHARVAK
jgi:hypothetical protein